MLFDRTNMIRDTINKYGIDNFYLSFSGGKDSTILHYLLDLAIPNNKIPRLFINTGMEFVDIVKFVRELQNTDDRIVIINSGLPITKMLQNYGYPFKSKQHSRNISTFQNSGMTISSSKYLGLELKTMFLCPKILKYQFTDDFKLKISDKCCYKLKKEPAKKWAKQNNKSIIITGMRKEEGGSRNNLTCSIFGKDKSLKKFHPLVPVSTAWEDWFIEKNKIKLCSLYYPPYNFERTGCKGCPFAINLQKHLDKMKQYLPNEYKQCEIIWKPIYDEYRRLGYRLKKRGYQKQTTIFDYE